MFPFDILQQAFEGNMVAWYAIGFGIFDVALFVFCIIVWWKMPQLAKAQFINNTIGGSKPTVAQCYEDLTIKFFNPTMHRNGIAYAKRAFYIPPKLWSNANEELGQKQKEILNTVYRMEGTQSPLFINYALQAGVVNPALLAMIQHEEAMKNLEPNSKIEVDKDKLIEVLRSIPDKVVQLRPLFFTFPLGDIRALKTWLPKSLSKSNLVELETKARQDERGNKEGFNATTILIILMLALIGISGISLAKQMGWI